MSDRLHFRCTECGRINRIPQDKVHAGPRCGSCKAALDTSGAPALVSDAELQRLIDSSPVPILVDFYADWCGPCRSLGPVLAELGREQAGRLQVVKIDTQRDQGFAGRLGVRSIPAVFLFKGGQAVDSAVGAQPLPYWRRFVRPHVA